MDEGARDSGSNPRIFVSYPRADSAVVQSVVRRLRTDGFQIWLDIENLQAGSEWKSELEKAIAGADGALVFLSRSGQESEWLSLEADTLARRSQDDDIPLVPVLLDENAELPEPLRHLHAIHVEDYDGIRAALRRRPEREVTVGPASEVSQALPISPSTEPPEPTCADVVVIGRFVDAPHLARILADALQSRVTQRWWGSGTGGAVLALAGFLGASEPELIQLGDRLGTLAATTPIRDRIRYRRQGWTLPSTWVDQVLAEWLAEAAGWTAAEQRAARFTDLDSTDRPADWLQWVALDLDARRPTLLPRHLDDLGRDGPGYRVLDVLSAAIAGLEGTPPMTIEDSYGASRELVHYPAFTVPRSLEAEPPEDRTEVVVVRPPDDSRTTSLWSDVDLEPELVPRLADDWILLDTVPDPAGAPGSLRDLAGTVANR